MNYPNLIKSKLPNVGTNIFTVMSKLATDNNAIILSQGFPDFACDPEMVALVNKHMMAGHNQYAPMAGLISLREMLSEKTEQLYAAKYDPDSETMLLVQPDKKTSFIDYVNILSATRTLITNAKGDPTRDEPTER